LIVSRHLEDLALALVDVAFDLDVFLLLLCFGDRCSPPNEELNFCATRDDVQRKIN